MMSLFEAYHRADLQTSWQVDDQLCGNLCRCTGYRAIRDAAFECLAKRHLAAKPTKTTTLNDGATGLIPIGYRTPAEIFLRPLTLSELLELLAINPAAHLVAGATELGLKITNLFHAFL